MRASQRHVTWCMAPNMYNLKILIKHKLHPKNYSRGPLYTTFYGTYKLIEFTLILLLYFTDTQYISHDSPGAGEYNLEI